MSNGVEVIVKGDKTNIIGGNSPGGNTISPMTVSPKRTTFPPSTVSRLFHLVEHPGKQNVIDHLLHSIVRSATPDMVTKTLVTTFTYMTTVLENMSTVVNSREQTISNVVTEKFRPHVEFTANVKAEPSSLPPFIMDTLYTSYLTNTLTTTYTYFNTFTAGNIPVVVTSRETVSNVITMPAYLATPSFTVVSSLFQSRIFETETYFTTFTFSKTLADENSRVVTTLETVTQVVVTEALIPYTDPVPLMTPTPGFGSIYSEPATTFYTTFTYLTTAVEHGETVTMSSISVASNVLTESQPMVSPTMVDPFMNPLSMSPQAGFMDDYIVTSSSVDPVPDLELMTPVLKPSSFMTPEDRPESTTTKKLLEPVMIFATKTYYTTYTYFTTVMGEGTSARVQSRTQVVSKVMTEALSTAFDVAYVNALKSSFLAKHSTLLEITSSVKHIIPDKTESVFLREPTLVTQSFHHPHWPKDEDEVGIMDPTTPSAGSSEQYEELKEGINHIVNVLADPQPQPLDDYDMISPSNVYDPLYSTIVAPTRVSGFAPVPVSDEDYDPTTENQVEIEPLPVSVLHKGDGSSSAFHKPTPPLIISVDPDEINIPTSKLSNPFDDPTLTQVSGPPTSILYYDENFNPPSTTSKEGVVADPNDFDDEDVSMNIPAARPVQGGINVEDVTSLGDTFDKSSSLLMGKYPSSSTVAKEDQLTLSPEIFDQVDIHGLKSKPIPVSSLQPAVSPFNEMPPLSVPSVIPLPSMPNAEERITTESMVKIPLATRPGSMGTLLIKSTSVSSLPFQHGSGSSSIYRPAIVSNAMIRPVSVSSSTFWPQLFSNEISRPRPALISKSALGPAVDFSAMFEPAMDYSSVYRPAIISNSMFRPDIPASSTWKPDIVSTAAFEPEIISSSVTKSAIVSSLLTTPTRLSSFYVDPPMEKISSFYINPPKEKLPSTGVIEPDFDPNPTQQIFNMLSEITDSGGDSVPDDYYDESKEHSAFKPHDDNFNSQVYNISLLPPPTFRPSTTSKPKQKPTPTTRRPTFPPKTVRTTPRPTTKRAPVTTRAPSTTAKKPVAPTTTTTTTTKGATAIKTTATTPKKPTSLTTPKPTTNSVKVSSTVGSSTSSAKQPITFADISTTMKSTTPAPSTTVSTSTTAAKKITTKAPMTTTESTTTTGPFDVFQFVLTPPPYDKVLPQLVVKNEGSNKDTEQEDDLVDIPPTAMDAFSPDDPDTQLIIKISNNYKPLPTDPSPSPYPEPPRSTYSTARPKTKSKTKATKKPARVPVTRPASEDAIPGVYNIGGDANSNSDEEDSTEADIDHDTDDDHNTSPESDEMSDFHMSARPPPMPPTGASGPSKTTLGTAISGPGLVGSSGGGSQVVSTSTGGINWTPLLNLGALGLGGLGASTLTRLGPMLSSVAGYMKNALPLAGTLARNDTHQRRPHPDDYPTGPDFYSPPHYNPMGPNFVKVASGGPPSNYPHSEAIPRRPILSHASNQNQQGSRDPSGPYHRFENGPWMNVNFPPTDNFNFAPPHDHQPNIFSQMYPINKHGDPPKSAEQMHVIKVLPGKPGNGFPQQSRPTILLPHNSNENDKPIFRPFPSGTGSDESEEFRPFPRPPSPPPSNSKERPFRPPWEDRDRPQQRPAEGNRPSESRPGSNNRPGNNNRPFDIIHINSHESDEDILFPGKPERPFSNEIPERRPNFPQRPNPPRRPNGEGNDGSNSHRFDHVKKPQQPLHHMDKVFYNNKELASGPENPMFTISIEKTEDPPHMKPTPNSPPSSTTKITITSHEQPERRPPPPRGRPQFSLENSAESHEHDNFVPPPKFPPTNSLHFLPTPPPMVRPKLPEIPSRPPGTFPTQLLPRPNGNLNNNNNNNRSPNNPFIRPMFDSSIEQIHANIRPFINQQPNGAHTTPEKQSVPPPSPNRQNMHQFIRNHNQNQNNGPQNPMKRPTQIHSDENNSHMHDDSSSNENRPQNRPPNQNSQSFFPNRRPPSGSMGNVEPVSRPNPSFSPAIRNPFTNPFQNMNDFQRPFDRPNEPNRPMPPSNFVPPLRGPPMLNQNGNRDPQRQRPFERPSGLHSSEFGNFAQPHIKQNVLLPGINAVPHPTQSTQGTTKPVKTSGEKDSSLENHRLPPSYARPTPHIQPHQQRPSTIFIVEEMPALTTIPTRPTLPSTPADTLIIKEIPKNTMRAPIGGFRNVSGMRTTSTTSTSPRPPARATISKLNFTRRLITTPSPSTSSASTERTRVNSYIVSPTVVDLLKLKPAPTRNTTGNNRFSGRLPNFLQKGPIFTKMPMRPTTTTASTTTRRPFDATKYFTNVATSDPNFGQDVSGSEDMESVIDPVNHKIIKSPYDSLSSTTPSFNRIPIGPNSTSPAAPESSEEDHVIPTLGVPNGFIISTPDEFKDLWWPTTFKPKPTSNISAASSTLSKTVIATTQRPYDKATTFRNTIRPTTFRPSFIRVQADNPAGQMFNPNIHNPFILRPNGNGPTPFSDDDEGIENVKIKSVEIFKDPGFPKPNQNQNRPKQPLKPRPPLKTSDFSVEDPEYSEEYSEEVKDLEKIRRPLASSNEEVVERPRPASQKPDPSRPTQPAPSVRKPENGKRPIPDEEEEDNEASNESYDNRKPPFPAGDLRPPPPPPGYNFDPGNPPPRSQHPAIMRPSPPNGNQQQRPMNNVFLRPMRPPNPADFLPPILQNQNQNQDNSNNQRPTRFRPPFGPVQGIGPRPNQQGNDNRNSGNMRRPFPPPPQQQENNNRNPGNVRRPFPPQSQAPQQQGNGNNNRNPIRRPPIRNERPDSFGSHEVPKTNLVKTNIIRAPNQPPIIPLHEEQTTARATKPTTSTASSTAESSQNKPDITMKQPFDSQEESQEENESNEIIIDPASSSSTTPREGSLIVQNQERGPPDSVEASKPGAKPATAGPNRRPPYRSTTARPTTKKPEVNEVSDEYEEEEEYEDSGDSTRNSQPKLQAESTIQNISPLLPNNNRPMHAGGHLTNNDFRRPRPPPDRPPGPFGRPGYPPGQQRPFAFDNNNRPFNPPQTEMQPPPPNYRQRPPILDLPSGNPTRSRPPQPPGRNPNRPNLLRPNEKFFSPSTPIISQITIHTIASVDEDNKIVATNVFTAVLPSHEISAAPDLPVTETLEGAENIQIQPTPILEGSEASSTSSVVIYSSGTLQTLASYVPSVTPSGENDFESDEEEFSEEEENQQASMPSKPVSSFTRTRSSVSRTPIKPTIMRTRSNIVSPTPALSATPTITDEDLSTETDATTSTEVVPPATLIVRSSSSTSRFVMPTRNPLNKLNRGRLTTTTESPNEIPQTTPTKTKETTTRKTFVPPTRNYTGFPPWSRRGSTTTPVTTSTDIIEDNESEKSDKEQVSTAAPGINQVAGSGTGNSTRRFMPRRPTVVSTTTSATTKAPDNSVLFSRRPWRPTTTERSTEATPKATTFRPFRRPPTKLKPTLAPTTTTEPSENDIEDESDKVPSENRRVVVVNSSTSISTTKKTVTVEESVNDDEHDRDKEETSVVTTTLHSADKNAIPINPTRVSGGQRGKFKTSLLAPRPKPVTTTPDPSPNDEDNLLTTRFVTQTETSTQTVTETETTVMTSSGQPLTHTIMITKTLPPQTLISTIVGTVTLVNTVEVEPTTVRTTIFAEPTIIIPGFGVETPEETTKEQDQIVDPVVLKGGVLTRGNGNRRKNQQNRNATPGLTTESSVKEKAKRKNEIPVVDCDNHCSSYRSKNQMCRRYANGTKAKCVCKPGYARMKSSMPCKPTYSFEMSLGLSHMEGMDLDSKDLENRASENFVAFSDAAKEALDKAFLSSDIWRAYQGGAIMQIVSKSAPNASMSPEAKMKIDFLVQLSHNISGKSMREKFLNQLQTTNFSIGKSGIMASKSVDDIAARDFNECAHRDYNDCSPFATCINLQGSFSCECRRGFKDNSKFGEPPGRDCLEMDGCEKCNYRGDCVQGDDGIETCHCRRWYGGSTCQINLKFVLIAIIVIGLGLFIMVLSCGFIVCKKDAPPSRERAGSGRFLRYRSPASQATLERTAIMHDSCSSDGSQTPPARIHPHSFTPDSLLQQMEGGVDKRLRRNSRDINLMNFTLRNAMMDQQDRSLTVVIPRAKIRPASRPPSRPTHGITETHAEMAHSEQKLLSYLDHGVGSVPIHRSQAPPAPSTSRQASKQDDAKRKFSLQEQRKISSGALVSSGTEVSAQGGMRRRSTGLPLPSEGRSTARGSISEVRSINETVRSPAKPGAFSDHTSRASCYSCKPPSYCAYSESHGHTMAEKDGASTVYTTQGKLFRMSHGHGARDFMDDSDSISNSE